MSVKICKGLGETFPPLKSMSFVWMKDVVEKKGGPKSRQKEDQGCLIWCCMAQVTGWEDW